MRRGVLATLALALAAAAVLRRRLDLVEVRGGSMAPTLLPGDRLLIVATGRPPRPGDVVVATDPRDGGRELVKRVAGVDEERVALASDSPLGRSTSVATGDVRWRVALRTWPPARVGGIGPAPPVGTIERGGESACAFPEALVAGDPTDRAVSPARSPRAGSRPPSG